MTTAGGNQHIGITIEAQDRASRTIQNVGQSLRKNLGSSVKSAGLSMLSFTSILSAVGLSITGLIVLTKNWIGSIRDSNRSLAIMQTRLELSGFSADRTAAAVERLRNNLSRATTAALPGFTKATQDFILSLGGPALKQLDELGKKTVEAFGGTQKQAIEAISQALQGNFDALNKLTGLNLKHIDEVVPALEKAHKNWLESLTPVDEVIRTLKKNWGETMAFILEQANKVLGRDLPGVLEGIGNIIGTFFQLPNLGTDLRKSIEEGIKFVKDNLFGGDEGNEDMQGIGRSIGLEMVLGLLKWFIGDQATELVRLAWLGNWEAMKEELSKIVPGWGGEVGTWIRDGLIKFIVGDTFGQKIIDALESESGLAGTIRGWAERAGILGQGIGRGIGNGIITALESAINLATGFINDWISETVAKINSIPGVPNFRAPQIERVSIPRLTAPVTLTPHRQGAGPIPFGAVGQPLTINMNGRQVATAIIEVLNGEIRVRQPGLGIGV